MISKFWYFSRVFLLTELLCLQYVWKLDLIVCLQTKKISTVLWSFILEPFIDKKVCIWNFLDLTKKYCFLTIFCQWAIKIFFYVSCFIKVSNIFLYFKCKFIFRTQGSFFVYDRSKVERYRVIHKVRNPRFYFVFFKYSEFSN